MEVEEIKVLILSKCSKTSKTDLCLDQIQQLHKGQVHLT